MWVLTNAIGECVKEFKEETEMYRWLNEQELPLKGGPYRIASRTD